MKTKTRDEKMKKLNAEIEALHKKLYHRNTTMGKETEEQRLRRLCNELEALEEKQAIEELQDVFNSHFGSAPSTSSEAWGSLIDDVHDDYDNLVKTAKKYVKKRNSRWLVDYDADSWIPATDAELLKYIENEFISTAIDIKTWKVYDADTMADIEYKLKPKFKK